jgi:hypothetical protein
MTVGTNKSRKDMRAVVSLVARYRSPTTFEYASEFCSDVSVGGMFITSAAPAPTGTLLKLECESDLSKEAQIRGVARVVWLRREANENGPAGMGVKFVKLEPGSRELIEGIVQRLAEAGVQARSMSAAPENLAAAAVGGGVAATTSQPAPQALRLVHSSAPPAADSGEGPAASGASAPEPTRSDAPAAEAEQPLGASVEQPAVFQPAIAERPYLPATGSSRPPPPAPSRFGWKVWVLGIVLVLAAIAIADQRRSAPKQTPVTPAADSPPPVAAPEKPVAAEPAPPPPQPKAAEEHAPTPAEPAEPAEPAAAQPAEPSPAQPETPEPSAETPAAKTTGPLFPLPAGQTGYVVEFVSRPNGATVTIDQKLTVVTPKEVNLGGMPARVKITAKKEGFKSSSIWMTRDGFEHKDGAMRKRAYLTLKSENEK